MKMNKKGFTIVELVIVIAVIAILAGVMIPTFGSAIESANESAALQEASAVYKEIFIANAGKIDFDELADDAPDFYIVIDEKYVFAVTNGVVDKAADSVKADTVPTGYEEADEAPYAGTKATAIWVKTATTTPSTGGEGGES